MLSNEELKELQSFKVTTDSYDIRFKEIIKEKLINNNKIIHTLNNKELEESEAEADEYFGENILPFYLIHPTQSNVQNFICYEVQFDEEARYNQIIKINQLVFHILCEQKNIIDKDTYIARHDLLAALIQDEFNWTNYFGTQIHCVSDVPSVVDNDYSCRTLIFESEISNSITKTKQNRTRYINSEVHV